MVTPAPSTRAFLFLALLGLPGCSRRPVAEAADAAWFHEITREAGLDFVHRSGATGRYRMPEIMGGGVALFDADGDGDLELYCVDGNAKLPAMEREAQGTSRFYRQDAPGRFTDATRDAGLADGAYGMGVAVGDADNDGDEDLYVTHYGPNTLFLNGANASVGRFQDATARAGVAGSGWSSAAAFFDADRDGFLDLFVVRYLAVDPDKECFDTAGRPDYCGPKAFPPVHDLYFRNTGDGVFRDETHGAGVDGRAAAGLGVVCADLDDDGWQDVYVANDAYANHLWINQQDGTLREEGLQRGAALSQSGQPRAGMGLALADFDGDARLDIFVSHLREEANGLFLNRGEAGFRDATGESGLGPVSMPFTGFGTAALDFDRDTDVDIVVANGAVLHGPRYDGVELPPPWDSYAEPSLFHLNQGGGRFTNAYAAAGTLASRVEIARGIAAGDVDGDGDPDLVVTHIEGPVRLFRNDAPGDGRHWIALRCVHPGWKRDALGARVELLACGKRQAQVLSSSWGYLASSPPVAYFGLGECAAVEAVEVVWPDGERERFLAPDVDRAHVLVRGTGGG